MKTLTKTKNLLILLGLLFFSNQLEAGIFDYTNQLDSIQLIYNENELRLPGESFSIGVVAYFKNGKARKTWNLEKGMMQWSRFNVEVKGGSHSIGKIRVNDELMPSTGKYIQVVIWPNKAKHLSKELLLPLNFEQKVEIIPVSNIIKAPGFGFNFKVVSTFDNGQLREYLYTNLDDLSKSFTLECNGGILWRDKFLINKDFRNITDHTVNLTAYSKRNPKCIYPFNMLLDYKAHYNLTLCGAIGSDASNESTIFDKGDNSRGPDIGVWVDLYFDEILNTNLLHVYVQNLCNYQEYRYLINPDGGSLNVTSRGSSGGKGGEGGDVFLYFTYVAQSYQGLIHARSESGNSARTDSYSDDDE